jgi:rubrerythrin
MATQSTSSGQTRFTLKEVLNQAIDKEKGAQKLYADLGKKAKSQIAKETFRDLVQQEHGHQVLLERYQRGELKGGALSVRQALDYKIVESTEPTEITPDMALKDIFLIAANREKTAHEGYLALAAAHPPGNVKKLLEDLASQELTHKHRLEFLYNETAFPQTDGG